MHANQDNIVFILVKPVFLGNIGSSARVLANFSYKHLRLVEPPRNYKDSEARRMSAGAFSMLKQAEVFDTLSDALKDISFAVGTTAGHYRASAPEPLASVVPDLIHKSQNNRVAWVFGDERNGLTREDLERCHRVATIATNPDCPSLNMAQAVCVMAYETQRSSIEPEAGAAHEHPTGESDDELFDILFDLLDRADFTRTYNRAVVMREMRSLYQRIAPTQRESDLLAGALRKINQKLSDG